MRGSSTVLASLLPIALTYAQQHDGNSNCNCYNVNNAYFTNYRFWDFRHMAQSPSDYTTVPPILTDSSNLGSTSDILQQDAFVNDWGIQDWNRQATADSPVALYNAPGNVYITQTNNTDLGESDPSASTYLTFRTVRLPGFQSGAEMESTQHNVLYASVRFRARVRGSAGACASIFTVYNEKNEADIEILTRESTDTIHYTNQPSVKNGNEVDGASMSISGLPNWDTWRTHRLDWFPGVVRSYIDDQLVNENKFQVPTHVSYIDINLWGDGGVWTGPMDVGGQAEMDIQWIQTAFNTSGKNPNSKRDVPPSNLFDRRATTCNTMCSIDNTSQLGTPDVISSSPSVSTSSVTRTHLHGAFIGFVVLALGITCLT